MSISVEFSLETQEHGTLSFEQWTVGRSAIIERLKEKADALSNVQLAKLILHGLLYKVGSETWTIERINDEWEVFKNLPLSLTKDELQEFASELLKHRDRSAPIQISFGDGPIFIPAKRNPDKWALIQEIGDPINRLCATYDQEEQELRDSAENLLGFFKPVPDAFQKISVTPYLSKLETLESLRSSYNQHKITETPLIPADSNIIGRLDALIAITKAQSDVSRESEKIFHKIYQHQVESATKSAKTAKRQSHIALALAMVSLVVSAGGIYYARESILVSKKIASDSQTDEILKSIQEELQKSGDLQNNLLKQLIQQKQMNQKETSHN